MNTIELNPNTLNLKESATHNINQLDLKMRRAGETVYPKIIIKNL